MDAARDFDLDPGLSHLNHAGVGPWPVVAREAACRFAQENAVCGSRHYPEWLSVETRLRANLARLAGLTDSEGVALLKSTSEALSVVAFGIDWQPGDEILIPEGEFPSNRIPWQAAARRFGLKLVEQPIDPNDPEAALIGAMNRRTRLLSVSAVGYASGLRLDLERLGAACRRHDTLFCVDAIQQIGALPFDAVAAGAHFVAADGHKWLCGPEGVALFWCHPDWIERLRLHQYGWHMVENAGDYTARDWRPAGDARRFECGSPNLLGIHVLEASTSLLLARGPERISAAVRDNRRYLEEGLERLGCRIHSPRDPARDSGILVFDHPKIPADRLYRRLMDEGVLCALRGAGVRFSPHYHNTPASLERALDHVRAMVS